MANFIIKHIPYSLKTDIKNVARRQDKFMSAWLKEMLTEYKKNNPIRPIPASPKDKHMITIKNINVDTYKYYQQVAIESGVSMQSLFKAIAYFELSKLPDHAKQPIID